MRRPFPRLQRPGLARPGEPVTVTPAGRAVALGGVLLLLLAGRSRAPGLYPLAALLLAALPVALASRPRLRDVAVTLTGLERAQVPAGAEVAATAVAVRWPGPGRLPPLRLALSAEGIEAPPIELPALRAGESATVGVRLLAAARRHHSELTYELVDEGVLGLARRSRTLALEVDLVVTPRWHSLPDHQAAPREGNEDSASLPAARAALRGAEPRGTRDFRAGDEARAVHWRTTARTGRLTVREWDPPRGTGLALLVQLAPDSAAPDLPERRAGSGAQACERLLEVVASLGVAAISAGRPVALVHARPATAAEARRHGVPLGTGVVALREQLAVPGLLAALAEVEPLRTASLTGLATTAAGAAGRGGTVVLAAGIGWGLWDGDDLLAAAEVVAAAGCTLSVLVGHPPAGPLPAGAAEAFGRLARVADVRDADLLLPRVTAALAGAAA